ncbi:MAG TPA: dienelactone hydrolase family protein [Steroidobacteraceae bacterium]|jgi:carboxymethylenebutenolidase|nr:dienelactone hydrolase family protein [Steroidobacteraceae bacterium]
MSEFTTIMARDGHEFRAWLAPPPGRPRGALVIVQEVFGVNSHIRAVTDAYAKEGFVAIAPCMFDRVRRGIELGYSAEELQEGQGYVKQLQEEQTRADLAAAIAVVKNSGRVGVVGYCWGGTMAYVAACDLPIACAVAYYGGSITKQLHKHPKCPVMYHFGELDKHITASDVDKIQAADPQGQFFMYPADHGFNCDQRASYDAASATLARERSLAFLARYVARPEA